ncbi:MAG: hypothetical protein V1936_01070 [Patescibacteria group bacterium]
MQKLSLKKSLVLILLAPFSFAAVGGMTFAMNSEIQTRNLQADFLSGDESEINSYSGTEAKKFEVGLQAPFGKPPEPECVKETEQRITDDYGYQWLCAKGSTVWVQIISGSEGMDILSNYTKLIYKFLAGFIGLIAVLMMVVGGIQIATAGANQAGLQSGRNQIFAALLGLTLLFLSSLILYTINPQFFGAAN